MRTCVPESWQAELLESCSFSCGEAEAQAEAACWQARSHLSILIGMTGLACDIYPSLMAAGLKGRQDRPLLLSCPSLLVPLITFISCRLDLVNTFTQYIPPTCPCCPTTVFWIPPSNRWGVPTRILLSRRDVLDGSYFRRSNFPRAVVFFQLHTTSTHLTPMARN